MEEIRYPEVSEFLCNSLRLRTLPVSVNFLKGEGDFPEKTRRPFKTFGKKMALCQVVTMARLYGTAMGVTREDLVCVPAAIAFGMSDSKDPAASLTRLFCEGNYSRSEEAGKKEAASLFKLKPGEFGALLFSPLSRSIMAPDVVLVYGNPAQVMRLAQSWSYFEGIRVAGHFGGKVECSEYLIAPFRERAPRMAVPGMGDRVFSLTQDDEMVFALPGGTLGRFVQGLKEAGSKVGARYPVPFYLNFQPEFPKNFQVLGKELGIL